MRMMETNYEISYLNRNQSSISQENKRKENFLNKKIEEIETELKLIEVEYFNKHSDLKKCKLMNFLNRKYYNYLKVIDNLFVKADYLDPISANLLMDDIDDRICYLKAKLSKTRKINDETFLY